MLIVVSIFSVLFVLYVALIIFYTASWTQIPAYIPGHRQADRISVIIPARNESANLPKLLQSLEKQTYPFTLFEVIVIDDHSEDDTAKILQAYHGPLQLRMISLADHFKDHSIVSHKKKAIETAINLCEGNLIVTTDADCLFHPDWLSLLADFHQSTRAKFIAAPVKFIESPTLLSIFQCLDFITLQGITAASVHSRFHTMCNGANLAYEKSAFTEVGGFAGIDQIPSGDDMLLMYKIARKYPDQVFYLRHSSAIVETLPASGWRSFFQQRIRWASKASHYDDKRIFWVLMLVYLFNLGFLFMLAASLFQWEWLLYILLFLVLKTAVEIVFVWKVAGFFGQRHLMKYFPLLQPFHILYTIIAGWLGKFGSFEWKGRTINTTRSHER